MTIIIQLATALRVAGSVNVGRSFFHPIAISAVLDTTVIPSVDLAIVTSTVLEIKFVKWVVDNVPASTITLATIATSAPRAITISPSVYVI